MARVYVGRRQVGGQSEVKTEGYVYFIRAMPAGLIKIGWSASHPDARLKRIRATSPTPIAPIAMMPGGLSCEAELHARFLEHWSHGEWFRPDPELVEHIEAVGQPWPEPSTKFHRPTVERVFRKQPVLNQNVEQPSPVALLEVARRQSVEPEPVEGNRSRDLEEWSELLSMPLDQVMVLACKGVSLGRIARYQEMKKRRPRHPTP